MLNIGRMKCSVSIQRKTAIVLMFLHVFSYIEVCDCLLLDYLVKDVFGDYERYVRPVCQIGETVQVNINLALRQIIDMDEPHQFLDSNIWIRMVWHDCRLAWNSSDFGDIDHFIVPQNRVWIPDLTLYDNANHNLAGIKDYQVTIYSNGTITYNFPSVIRSLCAINVKYFPFDSQKCRLKFGSWAYPERDLNLTNNQNFADLDSFVNNIEWEVMQVPATRIADMFGESVFPTVEFVIQLRRRPLFYVMNLLFPCMLITFVAVLGFMLPPDSGEKVNLEVTVLLSLAVFQLIVLEMMPPSGDSTPYLSIYFLLSLALVGFSCLMTVIVLKVHFNGRKQRKLPKWVKTCIVLPLAGIMCTKLNEYFRIERKRTKVSADRYRRTDENGEVCVSISSTTNNTNESINLQNNILITKTLQEELNEISKKLDLLTSHIENRSEEFEILREWNMFAIVLDRFFFCLYILMSTTGALALMLQYLQG